MIFPYSLVLGALLSEFFPEDIAPTIFGIFAFFVVLTAPICNIIFIILSRKDHPYSLVSAALLVMLVHIPAYVCIFLMGIVAAFMFFMTFPLILMFILFDCIVLFLSNLISVYALAKNIKNNKALSVVALICQFIFCADVISLLVLQRVSKKQTQRIST